MNEYILIQLSNNKKYIIIDKLNIKKKEYVLTVEASHDEKINNTVLKIFIYNEVNNTLDEIFNQEEYEYLEELFNKRLNNKLLEINILKDVNTDNLIKLKIKNINNNKYILDYNNELIEKYFEFYTKTKPEVEDYIYMSKNLLNEGLLSFGYIIDNNNLFTDDLLILQNKSNKIYYRRYYG